VDSAASIRIDGGPAPTSVERSAVFVDRDGVINRRVPGDYVRVWAQFHFQPGARAGLRLLREAGFLLIVVTNQRGVGRGLMSEEDLSEIHRRMQLELVRAGAGLDGILHCPHDLNDGCDCRKPKPGLLERAMKRFAVDVTHSWVVGDSLSDLEAGRAIGVRGILIVPGGHQSALGVETAGSLLSAARVIVAGARRA
jgi:D-glycero-D-manno-heptose 1,7-bisphosphate phosphatase